MTRMSIVPADVPPDVSTRRRDAKRRRRRHPRYLSATLSGWRFQIRIPRWITRDSTLAQIDSTIRVSLREQPIRSAERKAEICAFLCRAVFKAAAEHQEMLRMGQLFSKSEADLVKQVVNACQTAIAKALESPSEAMGIAQGLQAALSTLKLVGTETAKGEAGLPAIVSEREHLTRGALMSVLQYATDPEAALSALQRAPDIAPPVGSPVAPIYAVPATPPAPTPATPATSTLPTFGEISLDYIKMRIKRDGEGHKEIRYLYLRRDTFLEVVGDKPIDQYLPFDLQRYVDRMAFWPANSTKRKQFKDKSILEILDANQNLDMAPLARKTMWSYVAHIKTMARHKIPNLGYRCPFGNFMPQWPTTAAPSISRTEIPQDVLRRAFELGVQSGFMDTAMIPPLARATARRIGLLVFLRGSDIRIKDGVAMARLNGVTQVKGCWQRTPHKTDDSTHEFVIHNFFVEIGWVDWAMAQEDNWLFPIAHAFADPAKYVSREVNKLLRSAGALGKNTEVAYSLRGDMLEQMWDEESLKDRTVRLQSGHELADTHQK